MAPPVAASLPIPRAPGAWLPTRHTDFCPALWRHIPAPDSKSNFLGIRAFRPKIKPRRPRLAESLVWWPRTTCPSKESTLSSLLGAQGQRSVLRLNPLYLSLSPDLRHPKLQDSALTQTCVERPPACGKFSCPGGGQGQGYSPLKQPGVQAMTSKGATGTKSPAAEPPGGGTAGPGSAFWRKRGSSWVRKDGLGLDSGQEAPCKPW